MLVNTREAKMRIHHVFLCGLAVCAWSLVYGADPDSAYAPVGRAADLNGSVRLQDGNGGVELVNDLREQDPKKKYELYPLASGCPASGTGENGAQEKLKQAAKSGQKLGSFKGDSKGSLVVKGLSVKAAMSRGILLTEGGQPVSCADVAPPSFGPPPALPKE
jgi:hypothetical protein